MRVRGRVLFPLLVPLCLLAGCAGGAFSPGAHSTTSGFAAIDFPADQASHRSSNNEWWYVVGHLRSGRHRFGFQTTIFKFVNLRPPGFTAPVTLYRTDLAITDEGGARFFHQVRTYFPQSASLSEKSLHVVVGSVSLSGPPQAMRLNAPFGPYALHLRLASRRPQMNVNGSGHIPFGDGFSYYYSLTDLNTSGTLVLDGRHFRVEGLAWIDHQWGNWTWTAVRGWTWMALQLSNGTQFSVFDFRGRQPVKEASIVSGSDAVRVDRGVRFGAHGAWHSPRSGAVYPSNWTVYVPLENAVLQVQPTVRDQEMTVEGFLSSSYWEGSAGVSGTWNGKAVTGVAYVELTGYAAHRSGLP